MVDFEKKNSNINEEENRLIKSLSNYDPLETHKTESRRCIEKEETKIDIEKNRTSKEIIKFKCTVINSSHKNSSQKAFQNSIKNKPKFDIIKNDNEDLYKLRRHLFKLNQIIKSNEIKINELNSINFDQINRQLNDCINKLYEKLPNQDYSLSEDAKTLNRINYVYLKKVEIENLIENLSKKASSENDVITKEVKIEQNKKRFKNNNHTNIMNELKFTSYFSTQEDTKKIEKKFLCKKRVLQEDKFDEIKLEEKKYIKEEKSNIDIKTVEQFIPKKKGRLSNNSKKNGIKGNKDDTHPDNGLTKMMRHSLKNIYDINSEILKKIDSKIDIFFPGIYEEDLKNTDIKQIYLEKTILEILCDYCSKESQKDDIEKNKKIFNDLLKGDKLGKEERRLLEKLLYTKHKDVFQNYINNNKDFIDGYTFITFGNDNCFKKYDNSIKNKFIEKAQKLIDNGIKKRKKKSE